jgi:cyclopropane fatty-acyl-phospholipid synthase-like methyltransferase
MSARPDAPATARNRDAIIAVLGDEFKDRRSVLEIGSGTGQHAVYFGPRLPHLKWQTSDVADNHAGITAWIDASDCPNVLPPIELDVLAVTALDCRFDAVFSANTAHIMSFAAVTSMFSLVGDVLADEGVFCLYGPFNVDGQFTSESNAQFDQSLRARDPDMGIRDLGELESLADAGKLGMARRYAMPSNNMLLVFART